MRLARGLVPIKKIYIHLKRPEKEIQKEEEKVKSLGSLLAERKFVFALTFVEAFKTVSTFSLTDFIHYNFIPFIYIYFHVALYIFSSPFLGLTI